MSFCIAGAQALCCEIAAARQVHALPDALRRSDTTRTQGQGRRYDIAELAVHSDFMDTAYLLLLGELPSRHQKQAFTRELKAHTLVHEQLIQFYRGFLHGAHPMAIMVGVVGALSSFYPRAANVG